MLTALAAGLVALLGGALALVRFARAAAPPDEWLLCVRDGRLVRAGVGIALWRRPGDVVVRFSSTVQRVGFCVEALTSERLRVTVEGFVLWSVVPTGDGPFRAFQKLGLVNLDGRAGSVSSPRHLLTAPQHKAFQQLLGGAVQRLTSTRALETLLVDQDSFVATLVDRLKALDPDLGVRLDQLEVVRVRPLEEAVLQQLAAGVAERVREDAARVRQESAEREQRRALESEVRVAAEKAHARSQELAREQALTLEKLEQVREVQQRQQALAHELASVGASQALELARQGLARDELLLAARLDRTRREAEATRDAIALVTSAEERKSQGVRDHELNRLVAEKVGDALKSLPLKEAKWVSIGADSPVASLAGLLSGVRAALSGPSGDGA